MKIRQFETSFLTPIEKNLTNYYKNSLQKRKYYYNTHLGIWQMHFCKHLIASSNHSLFKRTLFFCLKKLRIKNMLTVLKLWGSKIKRKIIMDKFGTNVLTCLGKINTMLTSRWPRQSLCHISHVDYHSFDSIAFTLNLKDNENAFH